MFLIILWTGYFWVSNGGCVTIVLSGMWRFKFGSSRATFDSLLSSWFQTFFVFWMFCAFFWVIPGVWILHADISEHSILLLVGVLLLVINCVACNCCWLAVCIVVVVLCVCCHLMCICCTMCVLLFFTLDAGLLARSQYSEGPATGHLDTGFSWFPCVYKQMLRWFPRFQVATTCFLCSPPDLNSLVTSFMFCIHVK